MAETKATTKTRVPVSFRVVHSGVAYTKEGRGETVESGEEKMGLT